MKYLIPIAAILMMAASSCGVQNDTEWVYMDESGCPPGWVEDGDRKTRQNLEGYLKGNNIVPIKIVVEGSRQTECNDCFCFTGRRFRVKVYESQVGEMVWFGFNRE